MERRLSDIANEAAYDDEWDREHRPGYHTRSESQRNHQADRGLAVNSSTCLLCGAEGYDIAMALVR
jgi:hypothetical protein